MKRRISHAFSIVYNLLSDVRIDPRASNFSIASRQVIDNYCRLKELNRSYPLFLRWLGFRGGRELGGACEMLVPK